MKIAACLTRFSTGVSLLMSYSAAAAPQPVQVAELGKPVSYDRGAMLLVGLVLLVLSLLFVLMMEYSNRLAQTGPLAIQVKDALHAVRRQQIVKSLGEKWQAGQYFRDTLNDRGWLSEHAIPAPPAGLESTFTIRDARRQLLERGEIGTLPPGFSDADEPSQASREYLGRLKDWWSDTLAPEARRRYREEEARELDDAGKGTFRYFDFPSLWGQGPEFVLQFTALVTIIFAVIGLAVLGRLGEQQSGTILAAIAGYVLGQASGRGARSPNRDSQNAPAIPGASQP